MLSRFVAREPHPIKLVANLLTTVSRMILWDKAAPKAVPPISFWVHLFSRPC